jgi:NAD(P)-dependent dehydrogenase (short-subunit alcohol dehydrogenase family)
MVINHTFDLEAFIRRYVTKRERSLLADDLARYDAQLRQRLSGSRVLVIGGAGSIGSRYIQALLRFPVAKLVVVDTNENGLTELVRDLRSAGGHRIPVDFVTYPVNFGDRVFEKLFRAHGPFDVVANFAAHKHVRSEKDIFSIEAMIENNVLRARLLLDLLAQHPPRHFFCVSTDKAANPVNIMGASKKLMEELILAYADRLPVKTARFANVAFSNGSLPQGFLDRLAKRQPWSCPLGIRRFFVSPMESGELCLVASILGESGDIVFPKLDEERDMIGFDQVAIDLLHALGLEPDICRSEEEARQKLAERRTDAASARAGKRPAAWPVYFFESDTSGEKAFEEFHTADETLDLARFANLGVVKNAKRRTLGEIDAIFRNLHALFERETMTKAEVVEVLRGYLPNFEHIEKGKGLDQRM